MTKSNSKAECQTSFKSEGEPRAAGSPVLTAEGSLSLTAKTEAELWTSVGAAAQIGTPADRAAVFDHILSATLRRQAIAPKKRDLFGLDLPRDMARHREAFVRAQTPAEVWYALTLLSNTRHDRHLKLEPVAGGLPVPEALLKGSLRGYNDLNDCKAPLAPARLATDLSGPEPRLFLVDWAEGAVPPNGIKHGLWLVSINGRPAEKVIAEFRPYHCHSTPEFFWYHLPKHLTRRGGEVPAGFWAEDLTLGFETDAGELLWRMDYAAPESLTFPAIDPRYQGWQAGPATSSYRTWLHPKQKVLALEWLWFGPKLVADCDALMAWAEANALLDHALIFDATESRGGDYGGYLLQRLCPTPIQSNSGDLRLSDAIPGIIAEVLAEDAAALAKGDRSKDEVTAMGWRRDWLETDVMAALHRGDEVSAAVPFKCAHLPKDAKPELQPAPVQFRGAMVCLTMPFGGSHIDQVVAQLHDNGRCLQIGLPLGGYSKTWVGTEVLRLPNGTPLAEFQWSCGNTFRPNGEVLESNPARPHILLPPSRETHARHHELLLKTALDLLAQPMASRPVPAAALADTTIPLGGDPASPGKTLRDAGAPANTALSASAPMQDPLSLTEFRRLFPALRHQTYLSICDKLILADPVRAGVDRFLDKLAGASANRTDHEELVESARARFARLINARPSSIAVMRNVSDGVNAVAGAFPFKTGENIVIALGAEHPNNTYPWLRLARRGVELRDIPTPGGVINGPALIEAFDDKTRICAVASVSFAPGARTDLTRLGEACRKRDILLLVDGVQSAGILHHDVEAEPIDAFATSTSKGLLGLYGFGFLYLAPHWIERLEPAALSRTGVLAEDGHSSMGTHDYLLRPDAGRFELGSYNLAGAYAADASLALLERIGTKRLQNHVLGLAANLRDGLAAQRLAVFCPAEGEASHLVTVGAVDAGGHGFSTDPQITELAARLKAAKVAMTVRRGQLRFGLHGYNDESDVQAVLSALA